VSERALLVDLYELTMAQAYLDAGLAERPATFSMYFRSLPRGWRYLVAAGLDDALAHLETLAFDDDELEYLAGLRLFSDELLARLRDLRFAGEVRAMREGTLVFPGEPLLEVSAPVLEAQLVETYLLNQVHLQTLLAAKAARSVDVAQGRMLVDFGLRRTHGADAGLKAARSSWLAGFDATSNVLAGARYGIPVAGTMAHSYVEAFEDELAAFRAFARSYPDASVLLVDTYDTVAGVRNAAVVGQELAASGHRLRGVRLDSGDLVELGGRARAILDEAGLEDALVFASGNLDEVEIERLLSAGAPLGGFGVGTRMATSADAPFVDMVYKLVELDGRPVLKLSRAKATLPGPKQVWRLEESGRLTRDLLGLAYEEGPHGGRPLLEPVMADGRRLLDEPLAAARERCAVERGQLGAQSLEATISPALTALRDDVAARR
jgi:nicotinate phosphoribosyltransferase